MSKARPPRTQHDSLSRYVFARPRAAAIVVRHVLSPQQVAALDLDTLQLLPSAHTRPRVGNRNGDLLFSVRLRHPGPPRRVRIAMEHQSSPDGLMPVRALVYACEQWIQHIDAQLRPPRTLPFLLPILLVQPPARRTPTRLSTILALPDALRDTFGAPFEAKLYVDDLSASVLDDSHADVGHLALVEITRTLLYAYRNTDPGIAPRLAALAPLFDTVLVHFGSPVLAELWTYVVEVFDADSPLRAIIVKSLRKAAKEMYVTIADDLRAKGLAEGRAKGLAEGLARAILRVLERRALPITPAVRERVLSTADEDLLQQWLDRVLTATSLDDVFVG